MSGQSAWQAGRWHDERGRFLPGNPGGPGNPMAREMARMRARFAQRVSDEVFDRLVDKLVEIGLEGNITAIKEVFRYRAGRPDRSVDHDDLDADELRACLEKDDLARRVSRIIQHLSPVAPPFAPAGRPEEEWRRQGPEARPAEPPVGSKPYGPAMAQAIESLRAAAEAQAQMDDGEGRQSAPMRTIADTSVPTVSRPHGAAPGAPPPPERG